MTTAPFPSDDDLLVAYRPDQVAVRLNCSSKTVYRLIKLGKLRAVLLFGEIRIPATALRAYLAGDPPTASRPSGRTGDLRRLS